MIIGITGASGSGKNRVAELLMQVNPSLRHIDVDLISHHVLTLPQVIPEIVEVYGNVILVDDKIDRKILASLAFNNRDKYDQLNSITWKYMVGMIDLKIAQNPQGVIINHALLPRMKHFDMCNLKILTRVPYKKRLLRAMKRDGITKEQFDERNQFSIEYWPPNYNIVIDNTYPKEEL